MTTERSSMSRSLYKNRDLEKLEPYEGKLSRTVLRGGAGSNAILLPDQTLENKQKFISQIMTSKSPMRSCDDIDEQALSYAEIKALCAGDPRIREKMDLDVQVAKLKVLRGDFQNQKYRLEDKLLKTFPEEVQKQKTSIAALRNDPVHGQGEFAVIFDYRHIPGLASAAFTRKKWNIFTFLCEYQKSTQDLKILCAFFYRPAIPTFSLNSHWILSCHLFL